MRPLDFQDFITSKGYVPAPNFTKMRKALHKCSAAIMMAGRIASPRNVASDTAVASFKMFPCLMLMLPLPHRANNAHDWPPTHQLPPRWTGRGSFGPKRSHLGGEKDLTQHCVGLVAEQRNYVASQKCEHEDGFTSSPRTPQDRPKLGSTKPGDSKPSTKPRNSHHGSA